MYEFVPEILPLAKRFKDRKLSEQKLRVGLPIVECVLQQIGESKLLIGYQKTAVIRAV